MQQRRLRLGDILDDYCPRERRITNHAIVAMIEDEIRQTRCTTCDAEHEFKHAKMPTLRRKKDSVATAYKEVLAGVTTDATMQAAQAQAAAPPAVTESTLPFTPARDAEEHAAPPAETREEPEAAEPVEAVEDGEPHEPPENGADQETGGGRVHRRLIRATLPRPDNQPAPRPVPEFTMRQPQGRGGKFRGGRGPAAGRMGAAGRASGHGNAGQRTAGFSRSGSGRAPGARSDFHRSPRGGQPPRRDKKHSK